MTCTNHDHCFLLRGQNSLEILSDHEVIKLLILGLVWDQGTKTASVEEFAMKMKGMNDGQVFSEKNSNKIRN